MKETQYISSDFLAPRDAWDKLSIEEQAAMMRAAISEGILDLGTIRQKYNEFAEGGNTDDDLVDWIIREEGFIASPQDIGDGKMTLGSGLTAQKWHDQYRRNGNKWTSSDNRRAVREEVANRRRWAERNIPNWDSLPSSSQKALLSYKYNYDFNQANSPKLFKALADSNLQEAARQMDATSSNPAFKKGLQDRRQREQEWFLKDVTTSQPADITYQPAVSTQVYNPYVQQVEATRMLPINEPDTNSYIRTREVSPQEQRRRKFQENVEAYQRFNALMNLIDLRNNPAPSYVSSHPLFELVNGFAEGGDINPGMTGMMKSKLATAAHFGNPTARRMTNYDTRSYTWPGEYEYDNGIGEPKRGNVFVGSYDNLVTPHIQDTGKELTFVENVWSPENDRRSFMQSLKFNNEKDARYFGEHYKEIAPMMNLYKDGGHKIHIKPENRGKFTALKERTGHSATWFKEHGTPAQKKMATFALNARHWKHGLGGNLFVDGGDSNPMNYEYRGSVFDNELKRQGITHIAELPEVTITGRDLTKPYKSVFAFNPTNIWQSVMPQDAHKFYNTFDPNRKYNPVGDLLNYKLGYNNRKSVLQSLSASGVPLNASDSMFYNTPEAALALYLDLGDKEFQTKSGTKDDKISNYFKRADYKPTKGKTYHRVYKLARPEGINTLTQEDYSIPLLNDYIFAQMVARNNGQPVNVSATSLRDVGITPVGTEGTHAISNVTTENYTIGLGKDLTGPYISYYDEYDLNSDIFGNPKTGDVGFSISDPFSIYDRKYYNKEDSAKVVNAYRNYGESAFDKYGKLKKEYE